MAETTPGYEAAYAAARVEGHARYIHLLATQLAEQQNPSEPTPDQPPIDATAPS